MTTAYVVKENSHKSKELPFALLSYIGNLLALRHKDVTYTQKGGVGVEAKLTYCAYECNFKNWK